MEIDVPRLRKALEHITAHPEEWKQDSWALRRSCGTAYCLAGTIVVQSDAQLTWEEDEGYFTANRLTTGETIVNYARTLLNVGWGEVDNLFNGENSLRELYTLANEYTNGEIDIPDELPDGS